MMDTRIIQLGSSLAMLIVLLLISSSACQTAGKGKWFRIDSRLFPKSDLVGGRWQGGLPAAGSRVWSVGTWPQALQAPPPPPQPPTQSELLLDPSTSTELGTDESSLYHRLKPRGASTPKTAPAEIGPKDGTELSCTIILYGSVDYRVDDGDSACMRAARKARSRCGGASVNFVLTHFVQGTDKIGTPQGYCYKLGLDPSNPNACTAANSSMIDNFRSGMNACFEEIKKQNFTRIKVTPHVDDGTGQGYWRNAYYMDPFLKGNGQSYADIMVNPLVEALSPLVDENLEVDFSLQGEMNLAVVAFPKAWQKLAEQVKSGIAKNAAQEPFVKVGVSLNFNKMCGQYNCGTNPQYGGKKLPVADFKTLLSSMDFLGMSAYPPLAPEFKMPDLEASTLQMAEELLNSFKVNLKALISQPGYKFYWSEFGIGGGTCPGYCKANDVSSASYQPWYGMYGTYKRSNDPWVNPALKKFRYKLFSTVIRWLKQQGGPRYRVDGVYLWNMASWDIAGLYHDSSSKEGSYYDPPLMECIKKWNDNRVIDC